MQPKRPPPARIIGKRQVAWKSSGLPFPIATAMSRLAIIVATKLSSKSEQFPAMSFTLSPMKSATVFGIRESSSGRSWRIFATISAEMSAALV